MSKRRLHLHGLALLSVVVILTAVFWGRRTGFATPAACLDAYREAKKAGDADAYLRCLGGSLLDQTRRQFPDRHALASDIRLEMEDVRSWVQSAASEADATTAQAHVDEVRPTGTRRLLFQLENRGRGWLIVHRQVVPDPPASIPFGTHVKDAR